MIKNWTILKIHFYIKAPKLRTKKSIKNTQKSRQVFQELLLEKLLFLLDFSSKFLFDLRQTKHKGQLSMISDTFQGHA
jgi:hypothetical protein